jgi:hypothetical protein
MQGLQLRSASISSSRLQRNEAELRAVADRSNDVSLSICPHKLHDIVHGAQLIECRHLARVTTLLYSLLCKRHALCTQRRHSRRCIPIKRS